MDGRGRARYGAAPDAPARARHRRQDRRVAVARPRSAHRLRRRRPGGRLMDAPQTRRSRFVGGNGRAPIRVSFEFFPPKTEEMEKTLWEAIARLAPLAPAFVAVTRAEIDQVIRGYCEAGVRHIVALRGDPTGGVGERYAPHPGGYLHGADLVAGIKRIADVEVSVSAYPEKHPDSPTVEADIDMLKAKVDAGAGRAMTQFFFENDLYFRYLERVRARGISIPIVPGILPVQNFKQTKSFAERCGASVPRWLAERFAGLEEDAATRELIAAAVAAEQVLDLVDQGVSDFHFYTMNRADLVYAVCHLLGLRPASSPSPRRGEAVTALQGTTGGATLRPLCLP